MKNIHILSKEIPRRMQYGQTCKSHTFFSTLSPTEIIHNIYITSDEEISEGDFSYTNQIEGNIVKIDKQTLAHKEQLELKKVILTTDPDLIKDGVQAIDDEFLEWFVKNPSCEKVETHSLGVKNEETGESYHYKYEITIPKEEPKQETLEEDLLDTAIQVVGSNNVTTIREFLIKHKWQQEQDKNKFSEEEVHLILGSYSAHKVAFNHEYTYDMWFEQFKKK